MNEVELLAPGGDSDSVVAAILGGANAVYCGLDRFNARNRAANISLERLFSLIRFAHSRGTKIFLTLNTLLVDKEFPALFSLLNRLVNSPLNGVIVQDPGLFYILKQQFPSLEVHASTQNTTHNEDQIRYLKQLGAMRTNLSRELSLREITHLAAISKAEEMETEIFVHGSNCLSFSGICYMSSSLKGTSGNRGRCSQPCRDRFQTTDAGWDYPLNMKDTNTFDMVDDLIATGADSFKIEGRIKKYHYVYGAVQAYRHAIDSAKKEDHHRDQLDQLFHRQFTSGYQQGTVGKEMFSDNPMDGSAQLYASRNSISLKEAKRIIYDKRTEIIRPLESAIAAIDLNPLSLSLSFSGDIGSPLEMSVESSLGSWRLASSERITENRQSPITTELLKKNFRSLSELGCEISSLDIASLASHAAVPLGEITQLKRSLISAINEDRPFVKAVEYQKPTHQHTPAVQERSIRISSPEQIALAEQINGETFYLLPEQFTGKESSIFTQNPSLIPWFPKVLIGDAYFKAVAFLDNLRPARVATDNSGIAYACFVRNIPWIAGPALNCTNSHTIQAFTHDLNCAGVFLSNELSGNQIKGLAVPESVKIYYSVYHPVESMVTRQCLILTTAGCDKREMDQRCLGQCSRSTKIVHENGETFIIEKRAGFHTRLLNESPFQLPQSELPQLCDSAFYDLRESPFSGGPTLPWNDTEKIEIPRSFKKGI